MSDHPIPPDQDHAAAVQGKKRRLIPRVIYMVLMGLALHLAVTLLFAVALVQLLLSIASDESNERLRRFGRGLGRYLRQIADFLSFAREDVPFPFNEWPDAD
ncbi:DUF4389 domain-containing protein [Hylemonella sp. W303a]|uniref:DUF4389 domain-containing protein n=1 Tax=Hylemonella sp. W303a TaxID=3389873 RepID=UPI00396B0B83